MRSPGGLGAVLVLLIFSACADAGEGEGPDGPGGPGGGKADDPVPAPTGLDARPPNPTCVAPPRPAGPTAVTHRRAFPSLAFHQPVLLLQAPGNSARFYLVEKRGVVWRFSSNESTSDRRVVLDHRARVNSTPNEAGLLGMAFHPAFAQNGTAFLSYTATVGSKLVSRVTRIRSLDGGLTFDPSTETLVLAVEQPFSNHNGGHIAFGPDGFLYVGFGDGGFANDPHGHGQNRNTRLGSMLRIDVDAAQPFAVPPDNPLVGGGGLPEIYAWGLRNPWRFSFDRQTGALWVADVGQDAFEEIDVVVKGQNYGWNRKEGFSCFSQPAPCSAGLADPIFVYDHSQGDRSVTGGHVYRGSALPGLVGAYVFGDFVSGRVWALVSDGAGGVERVPMFSSGANISSFAEDHQGELYLLSYGNGHIRKIIAQQGAAGDFPDRLSKTGCFDPADPRAPRPGLIPFDVNAPLWSDGADKERYMALPPGGRIRILASGEWSFPTGTVLVKTFWLGGRRIETRLMVRHDDGGWAGYTYRWNAAQTDATLVDERETLSVNGQLWTIPSRADCMQCHTAAAGFALGPETAQLNGDMVYASTGRISNQVRTLAHIGMFENPPASLAGLPALPRYDDATAPVSARARAYLHSNCSQCHRPGGPGRSSADLRHQVSFAAMNVCNALPETGDFGIPLARVVSPGRTDRSLLSLRMKTLSAARMPPLGSRVVDPEGVGLVESWIASLAGCSTFRDTEPGDAGGPGGARGGDEAAVAGWSVLKESGVVSQDNERRYATAHLAPGSYRFDMTGTGEADLYVRAGAPPTATDHDCRAPLEGPGEVCRIELGAGAEIHVLVRGRADSSAFVLDGTPE